MATALIPLGVDAAVSDPVTLAAGESAQVFLITDDGKMPPSENRFEVDYQTSANGWTTVFALGAYGVLSVVIPGKITFRLRRLAGAVGSRQLGANLG